MKSSIAVAAALVLTSLAFIPGTAAAKGGSLGGGHGQIGAGQSGHGVYRAHPAFWGRGFRYGYGYGPGWCYWHPYSCSYRNR